jgi:hypothetical protein
MVRCTRYIFYDKAIVIKLDLELLLFSDISRIRKEGTILKSDLILIRLIMQVISELQQVDGIVLYNGFLRQ